MAPACLLFFEGEPCLRALLIAYRGSTKLLLLLLLLFVAPEELFVLARDEFIHALRCVHAPTMTLELYLDLLNELIKLLILLTN